MSAELLKKLQSKVGYVMYPWMVDIIFSEAIEVPLTEEDKNFAYPHHFRILFSHSNKFYEMHTSTGNNLNYIRGLVDRIFYDIECLLFSKTLPGTDRRLIQIGTSLSPSNPSLCNCGGPSKHIKFTTFEYDVCTLCGKEKK